MDSLLSNFGVTTNEFLTPVLLSLQVASIALIFSFVLGTLMARFMTKVEFKGKVILETIMRLTIVISTTVVRLLCFVIFGNNCFVEDCIDWLFGGSIIFTWYAGVLASTVVGFPLKYQSGQTAFVSIDKH